MSEDLFNGTRNNDTCTRKYTYYIIFFKSRIHYVTLPNIVL